MPVPTANPGDDLRCEGCTSHPPAWDRGRAAVLYDLIEESAGHMIAIARNLFYLTLEDDATVTAGDTRTEVHPVGEYAA